MASWRRRSATKAAECGSSGARAPSGLFQNEPWAKSAGADSARTAERAAMVLPHPDNGRGIFARARRARVGHALDAVVGALGALGHHVHDLGGLGLDLADQLGDLPGRALGLLGQLADLLGDDREAAALLAGPRRLDGGVQRQQVRLL